MPRKQFVLPLREQDYNTLAVAHKIIELYQINHGLRTKYEALLEILEASQDYEATRRIVKAFAAQNDILLMEALQRLVEAGEKALEGKK